MRHGSPLSRWVLLSLLAGCATAQPSAGEPDAAPVIDDRAGPVLFDVADVPAVPPDVPAPVDVPAVPLDVPAPVDVPAVPPDVPAPIDVPAVPPDVPAPVDVPAVPLDVPAPIDVPAVSPDLPPPPDVPPPPPPTFRDLLVQDVCARPDDVTLAADPFDPCPAGSARRDLRVGEALPYHRHDQPGPAAPQGYQRHDSYETPGARFVSTFDFAPFGEFNRSNDGYDAVEADGAFVSIIGTRDGGGLAQTFFPPGCALDDAWLLFPTNGFMAGGNRVARLRITQWERLGQDFPGRCPTGFDAAFTRWRWQRGYAFGGVQGHRVKTLDTLVVDHYGGSDPATADHIERFYFTTVYGLTRWERWNRAATPRAEGCAGPTAEGPFVRADCRDWTLIVPDPIPSAPEAWPVPYAPSNLVRNHDFGGDTVAPWARIGENQSGTPTNWSVLRTAGDAELATNCGGPCAAGQGIYQDVPRAGLNGTLRFGGRFRTDAGAGRIELVVFQRDGSARVLQRHSVSLAVTAAAQRWTSAPFAIDPGADHFRVQFYLNSEHTFRADDLWLAR